MGRIILVDALEAVESLLLEVGASAVLTVEHDSFLGVVQAEGHLLLQVVYLFDHRLERGLHPYLLLYRKKSI